MLCFDVRKKISQNSTFLLDFLFANPFAKMLAVSSDAGRGAKARESGEREGRMARTPPLPPRANAHQGFSTERFGIGRKRIVIIIRGREGRGA